jgi:hypothetical protein
LAKVVFAEVLIVVVALAYFVASYSASEAVLLPAA